MLKNISILTTSMLLLAACEKIDKNVKVNNQHFEDALEDAAEDIIENLFPVNVEIDIRHDDDDKPKG